MVASESQSIMASMDDSIGTGKLSAWLQKRKSEPKKQFFRSDTNRRFFTLDFDAQMFFYQHSESEKKISQPIVFRHIISVQPLTDTMTDVADDGTENQQATPVARRGDSKTSLASSLRKRMPSFSTPQSRAPKKQYGFVVETTDKSFELLCSSKMEAEQWVFALQRAVELGVSKRAQKSIEVDKFAPCNSVISSSRPTTADSCNSVTGTKCSEGSSNRSSSPTGMCVTSIQSQAETRTSMALPPKVPNRPPAMPQNCALSQKPAALADEVSEYSVADARVQDDKEAWGTASQQKIVSQSALADEVCEYSVADARVQDDKEAWGTASQQKIVSRSSPRYHDKAAGLSWQQRLEQLEFSDDEEED